jgi:hypothetical protein
MIKTGACDPGEDFEFGDTKHDVYGPTTYYGQKNRHTTQLPPRNTRTVSKDDVEATAAMVEIQGREHNIKGSTAAFLDCGPVGLPEWFSSIFAGGKPTVEAFFEVLPLIEPCRVAPPSSAGVIRMKNIPYDTSRSEIISFLGRRANIISMPAGTPYFAVHIVMERPTGKTMDAFIEFATVEEAARVIRKYDDGMMNGRLPKLGDRPVEVVLSSQEDLMAEMFPRSKKTTWVGNTPVISDKAECYYPNEPSCGFAGFLQEEELYMMKRHAELPHRVSIGHAEPF